MEIFDRNLFKITPSNKQGLNNYLPASIAQQRF
jgi:hypothetical protein